MKKHLIGGLFALVTACILTFVTASSPAKSAGKTSIEKDSKQLIFSGDNNFSFTGEVNDSLADSFLKFVFTNPSKDVYIYIDSPGGSVVAVGKMIEILRFSNKNFICVAQYAASAAFMFFEHCDTRYITNDGLLMSHNASITIQGEVPKVKSIIEALEKLLDEMDSRVAERLHLTYEDYKIKIKDDMWFTGKDAITRFAADDSLNYVGCTKELTEKRIKKEYMECSIFGCSNTLKTFSGCPLLTAPLYEEEKK